MIHGAIVHPRNLRIHDALHHGNDLLHVVVGRVSIYDDLHMGTGGIESGVFEQSDFDRTVHQLIVTRRTELGV
ncbi:MAG: hypothetical protein DMG68_21225 [Acidobacteria bacterium]|nr:MAG: hypothetical protein DMG68_21225 [Acidobacteriota bacterium]